jgi:hypothetical protein
MGTAISGGGGLRWVYGEKNFSGPYTGPEFYSPPNQRWRWRLF